MNQILFHDTPDESWARFEPVRLGPVSTGLGTADRFITFESDQYPLLRVDLYRSREECYAFEEACLWNGFLAIGWGHHLYLIKPETRQVSAFDLGSYFGHLYPEQACLLVASAERLFCIALGGRLRWQSGILGVDGVIVDDIDTETIQGRGEWDPPGGWRPFQISMRTGQAS